MLAQRLAHRTTFERDVGTQTSLSFETSSSIREEILALIAEENEMMDDKSELYDDEEDDDRRYHDLQRDHYDHLLDPNYDYHLLIREELALQQWERTHGNPSIGPTLDTGYTNSESGRSSPGYDVTYEDLIQEEEEDSVYAEVRAAVSNTDDSTIPTNTFRVWVLCFFWSLLLSGVNQFFYFRYPSVSVGSLVVQLLCYPMGVFMHQVLPPHPWFNPGPFNIKEHTVIVIAGNVSQGTAYATNIITVQRFFYNQQWSFGYQILLVLSTQLIGFSVGGLSRRFLVWPAAMIWPASLVNTALLNTLHSSHLGSSVTGQISRSQFFYRVTGGIFLWQWFPSYLWTALSSFDWVTWIAPQNVVVSQIFGYNSGMGLSLITFDWGQISSIGNPLATPWWAGANMTAGFICFICILYPALYYNGVFYGWYLPMFSSSSFDNQGQTYNVSRILTANAGFNETAYNEYSDIYVSLSFAMSYALSFACVISTLVHTFLYYRQTIWRQLKRTLKDENDIHARLMMKYTEVPNWWYAVTFFVNLGFALGVVIGWPTQMPVWALFLALAVAFFFALPVGIVQAITNQQVGLNVVTELIIGYANPGHPVSMMIFKTYGYITLTQGLNFANDMKPNICTYQSSNFWCPSTQTFGTSSVLWGLVGPKRQFNAGQLYSPTLYGFLAGAVLPVPFYYLARKYPKAWFKFVNIPVVFSTTGLVPPYFAINIASFCYTNFIFQYIIRRTKFVWWSRFNYILSAGLSAGYAIAVIIIFFTLQFPLNGSIGADSVNSWWGNTVYTNTADYNSWAYKRLPEGAKFGPGGLN